MTSFERGPSIVEVIMRLLLDIRESELYQALKSCTAGRKCLPSRDAHVQQSLSYSPL